MARIDELRQAKGDAEDKLKALAEDMKAKAEDGGDEYDAAVKAFDEAKAEVDDIEAKIKRLEDAETKLAATATPREVPEGSTASVQPQARASVSEEMRKLVPVRRMMADMIESHTKGALKADTWLELAYGEEVAGMIKATHQLTDYATGGALSLPDFAETIIEGLENMTVVRRMQPQVLSVPGALILPRETSAPDGSWLTENEAPEPGTFAFGDIRLDPKRLAVEVVISRRLLDQAARGGAAVRNLEAYVVRRLRERLAVNEDAGFLRGAGTEKVPLGIRNQVAAGNITDISGTTPAQIESDIRSRVTKIEEANIMITAGYWVMPPRTRGFLADLRNDGERVYPSIDANNNLLGYPILSTNQIPTNLGGTNTEIMFGDGPSILVANGSDAEVRVSIEGSYEAGGKHHSLIQRNEMLVHMELYADVKLERDAAFSVLTAVSY